ENVYIMVYSSGKVNKILCLAEREGFEPAAFVSPTTLANFCCYYQRYQSLARLFDFPRILVKCRCATVASSIRGVLYSRNILGVEALEDTAETGHRRFRDRKSVV